MKKTLKKDMKHKTKDGYALQLQVLQTLLRELITQPIALEIAKVTSMLRKLKSCISRQDEENQNLAAL